MSGLRIIPLDDGLNAAQAIRTRHPRRRPFQKCVLYINTSNPKSSILYYSPLYPSRQNFFTSKIHIYRAKTQPISYWHNCYRRSVPRRFCFVVPSARLRSRRRSDPPPMAYPSPSPVGTRPPKAELYPLSSCRSPLLFRFFAQPKFQVTKQKIASRNKQQKQTHRKLTFNSDLYNVTAAKRQLSLLYSQRIYISVCFLYR